MTEQHDFRPAFNRLSRTMGWDNLDDNGPPAVCAPRPMPPARQDAATISRRRTLLSALARIGQVS